MIKDYFEKDKVVGVTKGDKGEQGLFERMF
jgi:hypothetical protein